jgi:hypothetical protein
MGRKPGYTWHEDFAMPMGFPVEAFASALAYAPDADDVFIATYPKCGTTWTQYIIYLLTHGGRPLRASQSLGAAIPHLEEVGGSAVAQLPRPRFIKTHLPYRLVPKHEAARYLFVARNPFDCVVSFFHHTRGFPTHYDFSDGTFDEYFECFIAGEVDFGDYFEHLASWLAKTSSANVRMLTYEAMWAEPRAAISAIDTFIGGNVTADAKLIDAVLEHSSIASMRRSQQRWSSRRPDDMPAFVRRGGVGDWVNYFSPSQCQRVLERSEMIDGVTRLDALWPDVFATARQRAGDRT